MKKFLEEIGPILAGFQIATSIISFFGIGAIAKWIIEHWLPFTRWAWGELFSFIHLPEISIAEKDALTTLAFFAPMAISSFISKYEEEKDPYKAIRLKIYATFIGVIFIFIIGGRVIKDTITLFTTKAPESTEVLTKEIKPLLNIEVFANIGLISSLLVGIILISILIYWITSRNQWFLKYKALKSKENLISSFKGFAIATRIINTLISFISFSAATGGILSAASQLGVIRTVSPILILLSLLATIFFNPKRLLRTAGVVIALVLASYGWDAALWLVNAVESAPTN